MSSQSKVLFGIIRSFAEPTLLFLGDRQSLERLASFLRSASTGSLLGLSDWSRPVNIQGVSIVVTQGPSSVKAADPLVVWIISTRDLDGYADLIMAAAQGHAPAHAYLDVDLASDLSIVVSIGEYPDDVFD